MLRISSSFADIKDGAQRWSQRSDAELASEIQRLRFELMAADSLDEFVVPTYQVIVAMVQKRLGMTPYPTQMQAALNLLKPCIVEMATGEGKTLTALMPTLLRSLQGKGVLFATSNDYLASRDAEFARQVAEPLGISVSCVTSESTDEHRIAAYQCDITYGTTSQFGFDFLRDRAKLKYISSTGDKSVQPVGRGNHFVLIADEADSLLIDEAATPMVISSSPKELPPDKARVFQWSCAMAERSDGRIHYKKNTLKNKVELTEAGRSWVQSQARALKGVRIGVIELFDYVERAILIHIEYERDVKFVVQNGKIVMVDENTGRLGIGREWSNGIQQAIQAQERLPITSPSGQLAKISVQNFARSFECLSGMTGTASDSRREFRKNYKLKVVKTPTYRKCKRIQLPDLAFPNQESAFAKLAERLRELSAAGRPVLIGTRTIHISEALYDYLIRAEIRCALLNAKSDAEEADVIARAGQTGAITIATNMAGRGTDIKLCETAKAAGGLHVVVLGIHNSKRIDRQLVGRCARQGDPGSYDRWLILDDDLLNHAWGPAVAQAQRLKLKDNFSVQKCVKLFEKAQATIARRMESSRGEMLHNEKQNAKKCFRAGLDPVLQVPG